MKTAARAATALLATSVVLVAGAPGASASLSDDLDYVRDFDRYSTAVQLAGYRDSAPVDEAIVVASGEYAHLVDSVAAGPLAAALDAPILLTRASTLPSDVVSYLGDDGLKSRIVIVGGESSVSAAVERELAAYLPAGVRVERLSGEDRYATAAAVADTALLRGADTAFVASGDAAHLADAVSVGSVAGSIGAPVLLTRPDGLLPDSFLRYVEGREVYVVGGASVVAEETVRRTGATRLSGEDRYATSITVATAAIHVFGLTPAVVAIVEGEHFVDALTASSLGFPTVLSTPDTWHPELVEFLEVEGVGHVVAVGGFTPQGVNPPRSEEPR